MLKAYPTTFLLPKRLKLIPVAGLLDPDSAAPASQQTNSLSTDAASASLPPRDNSQPILLVAHNRPPHSMSDAAPRPRPQPSIMPYFPLGYKEAAQQWVGSRSRLSSPAPTRTHR